MNFVTLEFSIFFPIALLMLYISCSNLGMYKGILLSCNIFFYAYAGLAFLPLLLTVIILNWSAGRLLFSSNITSSKIIITINIILHILLLVFFKYYEFIVLSLESIFSLGSSIPITLPLIDIFFPIGLSFYTFQGLSYAIDQYRNPKNRPQSFINVSLFISFFPTVLAGPIMRGHQFFPQLTQHAYTSEELTTGFALILSGLFKKVVLASYLSEHIVREVFQSPTIYSSWTILAAVYSYSIQIFCDFSGYSDLAIGIGYLMGYRIPQNFHAPYLAYNLQIFWHCWHITLSQWLKDYLYIPLGGNKKGNRYINLIITMVIGGLWHGSHLRFLIWGFLHGIGLALVHFVKTIISSHLKIQQLLNLPFIKQTHYIISWMLTFHFVSFLWIFFRAEDIPSSLEIIKRILFFGQEGEGFPLLVIPVLLTGLLIQVIGPYILTSFINFQKRLHWIIQAFVLAFICSIILKMGPDGIMPFIYFQF